MYPNGLIPRETLTQIAGGHRLRADAAAAFKRLDEAFLREFKKRISVTDAYRDLVQQVAVKAVKGKFAATPGTSNHGWGIALDLGSRINLATSAEHRWMDAVAHEYGWVNPPWATDDNPRNGQFEPWHWEYVPHLDQHDGIGEHVTARPATAPAPPEKAPVPQEDPDMARLIRHPNGSIALVGPGPQMRVLHTTTEVEALRATGQATGETIQLPNPLIWTTCAAVAQRAGTYTP